MCWPSGCGCRPCWQQRCRGAVCWPPGCRCINRHGRLSPNTAPGPSASSSHMQLVAGLYRRNKATLLADTDSDISRALQLLLLVSCLLPGPQALRPPRPVGEHSSGSSACGSSTSRGVAGGAGRFVSGIGRAARGVPDHPSSGSPGGTTGVEVHVRGSWGDPALPLPLPRLRLPRQGSGPHVQSVRTAVDPDFGLPVPPSRENDPGQGGASIRRVLARPRPVIFRRARRRRPQSVLTFKVGVRAGGGRLRMPAHKLGADRISWSAGSAHQSAAPRGQPGRSCVLRLPHRGHAPPACTPSHVWHMCVFNSGSGAIAEACVRRGCASWVRTDWPCQSPALSVW